MVDDTFSFPVGESFDLLGTSQRCMSKDDLHVYTASDKKTCGTNSWEIIRDQELTELPEGTGNVYACSCDGDDCNEDLECPCLPDGGGLGP